MKQFERVRLHRGIGWVSPADGGVVPPPNEESFRAAARIAEEAVALYVVDTPDPVAVLSTDSRAHGNADEASFAAQLQAAGFPLAVWIELQVVGAAVARCYGDSDDVIERAACGVWALKALGGWDESEVMAFHITPVTRLSPDEQSTAERAPHAELVSVRGAFASGDWTVRVTRPGRWSEVLAHLSRMTSPSPSAMILAAIDWTTEYNNVYGREKTALMLARVHACIDSAARRAGAIFIGIGEDEFGVIVSEGHARQLAEAIRADVESMRMPFESPTVRTLGHVTVSIGVTAIDSATDVRRRLEQAISAAVQAGGNSVSSGRT